MVIVIGASSLHHSLERWTNIKKRLSRQVTTKPGYNLHRGAQDKSQIIQKRLRLIPKNEQLIIWHDLINNSVTSPRKDPRKPLTPEQLVNEIKNIKHKAVGIVYCVREGAPDVYKELKGTGIPVLHIVKDLLSRRKQKDKELVRSYSQLHLAPHLEIKTLTIVQNHGDNLKAIIKKKHSPSQQQRRKKQKKRNAAKI